MSRLVSLLLSAALTFGSILSAEAAPLAKKAGGVKSPKKEVLAKMQQNNSKKLSMRSLQSRVFRSGKVNGIKQVTSVTKIKNRQALKSATAAQRVIANNIDLRATMYSGPFDCGIYRMPRSAGEERELLVSLEQAYNFGSVDNGMGRYYGVNYTEYMGYPFMTVDIYDTETWEKIDSKDGYYDLLSDCAAADPTTGEIYGCFYAVEGQELVYTWAKADYENATSIPIASLEDFGYISVTSDKSGQFYGLGQDLILYKIDKATGDNEALFPIELPEYQNLIESGCINESNNTYLQTYTGETGEATLYEIDLESGEHTPLFVIGYDGAICGMYIAKPVAEDKAPAEPELEVVCNNGAMDVTVTLTMPETLFDGTPATGQTFDYIVYANGTQKLADQAAAGTKVNETITLTESGMTEFVATVSNAVGMAPKVKTSCFVGQGLPPAPSNVKLVWADGVATLTWDAVTESADGGYLDPAAVTYTIFSADGTEIKTQSETVYTQNIPMPETLSTYQFGVRVNYAGKTSSTVKSNQISLGTIVPPVNYDMTQETNFNQHTYFDANQDGKTWGFSSYYKTNYKWGSKDADDWLFSPAICLEAGKFYQFISTVAAKNKDFPERIEIKLGNAATVEGMTQELAAPTLLNTENNVELSKFFSVQTAGNYHVGFHAISDGDAFYLTLSSYSIVEVEGTVPNPVTEAKVEGDPDGALKAVISFKAPAKSIDGNDIAGTVKVNVLRDGEVVKPVDATAGAVTTVEDVVTERGFYTYSLIPENASGQTGHAVVVRAFVGPKTPSDIDSVTLFEQTPGTFVLSWDAVTTATDGSTLNPNNVSYKVYTVVVDPQSGNLKVGEELATVTNTTYTYVTEPIVEQGFFRMGVQAVNQGQLSDMVSLGMTMTGTPYEMPVRYSNAEDLEGRILGIGGDGDVSFGNYMYYDIAAQDDDDAFFVIYHPEQYGATTTLLSGKIQVTGEDPVLQFYLFPIDEDDENETIVSIICDGQEKQVGKYTNSDGFNIYEWNRVKVSLAEYAGKTIQVSISAVVKSYLYTFYDNIQVCNDVKYDLSAQLSAPAKMQTGAEFDVNVRVKNEGANTADSYVVNLLRNGKVAESKTLTNLASNDQEIVTFKQSLTLYDEEAVSYQAEVVYAPDLNPDNNKSNVAFVERKISKNPVVTGLEGEKTDRGNVLTWDPVVIAPPTLTQVTEDFEGAESWALEVDGWTLIDKDGMGAGGFQQLELPGIIFGETKYAYFVFDASGSQFNETFDAHSGDKYLATLFNCEGTYIDKWLISPELTGIAQTIKFFAQSYSANYPEKIEVWYSTTDNDPDSFVKIPTFGTKIPPEAWTEYSADLPEGTRYFAIRSCAADSFMLMLDDITFQMVDGFKGELLGYNIYCDGIKLNDTLLTEATYTHAVADDDAHTYCVTAVYDLGESELSTPVTINSSGIDSTMAAALKVYVEGEMIVVTGAGENNVTINAVDGRTIHAAKGDARVAVMPAVYLVTVNGKTVKVIVR